MALRRKQREATRNNVRAGVQQAHVILTNPTHFAVALRYDRATDRAPVVVAKGKGLVAEVIRELAAENKVPVLSYPLLARAVYFTSRAGQEIRDDLYRSEEHTSELQSIMRISYAVFCLNKHNTLKPTEHH